MGSSNDFLLSRKFPALEFAKEADEWLKLAKRKSIFWQLESIKISVFMVLPLISTAGLGIEEKTGKFRVVFNDYCKPAYAFECLGHEIGHTFEYDITKNPPVVIIDHESKEFQYDFDDNGKPNGFLIEDFCDEFSKKWMLINTKERIEKDCGDRSSLLGTMILMFSNFSDRTRHK